MQLAADSMTRITMELGGHAPVLIFDDCDLEKTLDMVVPQKFRNAGQVCVSPTRFYVQEAIYDAFLKGFAERTAKVKVGDGLDADTQHGPARQCPPPRRGRRADRRRRGQGRARPRRRRTGDSGFFFQPTLLADVPNNADIMNEEPFGPVAVTAPSRPSTKRSSRPTACPSASPPSPSPKTAAAPICIGDAIESGMVGINTFAISVADAPFGGVKDSGFGSEGGKEGLESYQVVKAIHKLVASR